MNKMKRPEVSIAMPIYNEEKGVGKTVANLVAEFEKNNADYQIVLVNHGSTDDTDKVLGKMADKNKRLKLFNLPKNLGYGGGIMFGFDNADGQVIGFTCADEEVSAQDVYRVYAGLKDGKYDVSKSRRLQRKDGVFRIITTTVFNTLIRIRFSLNLKDTNGYPIFMKRELFPPVRTKELAYLFNIDFLRKMGARGYKILEVPIIHGERETGKSFMKLSRIFNMAFGFLLYMFKL